MRLTGLVIYHTSIVRDLTTEKHIPTNYTMFGLSILVLASKLGVLELPMSMLAYQLFQCDKWHSSKEAGWHITKYLIVR